MDEAVSWRILILMMLHSSTFFDVSFIIWIVGGSIRDSISAFIHMLFTIFIVGCYCLFLRDVSDFTHSEFSKCCTYLDRLILKTKQ